MLKIKKLGYSSSPDNILEEVQFSFREGKVYGLSGASGVGKSSLLLAMANLESSECIAQLVWIGDTPKISLMAQQPTFTLNPVRKVGKSLLDVYNSHSVEDNFKSIIQFCSLDEKGQLLNRYPHECSGGELQRLVLAMSMFQSPDILLLDEPTAGIDHLTAGNILLAIKRWAKQKEACCLIASHDDHLLSAYADERYMIENQKLVQIEELYRKGIPMVETSSKSDKKEFNDSDRQGVLYEINNGRFRHLGNKNNLQINTSLKIHKGEIVGLTGKSGTGKSTLGKLMARHLSWESGQERRNYSRLQYLHQDPVNNFHPNKNLDIQLKPIFSKWKKLWDDDFMEVLNLLEINAEWLQRNILSLSGGQRQRVLMARALLCKPELLIIDESFSGLDFELKINLWSWLIGFRKYWSFSILLITHDLELITQRCDVIYIMDKGKVLDKISKFEPFERNSLHPVTKSLLKTYI